MNLLRILDRFLPPSIVYAGGKTFTPVVNAFRFYNDGTESGSSPWATAGTNVTVKVGAGNRLIHLRYRIDETGGASGATTDDYHLQVSKNGGAYANVTGATSNVHAGGGSIADTTATTDRATNGISNPASGSFVASSCDNSDAEITNFQLTSGNFTEMVFELTLVSADLADTNTLDFRLTLNAGSPGMTNNVTPRITIDKGTPADLVFASSSGSGTGAVSGLGFSPKILLLQPNSSTVCRLILSSFPAGRSIALNSGTFDTSGDYISSLDSDGFTPGSLVTGAYFWAAWGGAENEISVFSYTGDGVDGRFLDCGFTPDVVCSPNNLGATQPVWRISATGGDAAFETSNNVSNVFQGIETGGVQLGSGQANGSGNTYYFFALKHRSNVLFSKEYTGNGTDDTTLTGAGFAPDFALHKDLSATWGMHYRFKDETGDASFLPGFSELTNRIQAFTSDGDQIGTDAGVNANGDTYAVIWAKAVPPPSPMPSGKPSAPDRVWGKLPLHRGHSHQSDIQLRGQDSFYAGPGQVITYDLPNPPKTRRPLVRDFAHISDVQLIGQDIIYGARGEAPTYDWPVPKGRTPGISLRTWLAGYDLPVGIPAPLTFPHSPILDSFDGSDLNPLNGTGIWNAGVFFGDAALQRTSNHVASSVAGFGGAYTNASYSNTQVPVELYITRLTTGATLSYFYWNLGGNLAAAPDGYAMRIGGGGNINIYRSDAGALNTLISSYTQSVVVGDSAGIRHNPDGTIETWFRASGGEWTLLGISAPDVTYTSGPLAIEINDSTWDTLGGGISVPVISTNFPDRVWGRLLPVRDFLHKSDVQLIGLDVIYGGQGEVPTYTWPVPRGRKGLLPEVGVGSLLTSLYVVVVEPLPDGKSSQPDKIILRILSRADFVHETDIQLIGQDSFYDGPGRVITFDLPNPPKGRPLPVRDFVHPTDIRLAGQDTVYGTVGEVPAYDWQLPTPKRISKPSFTHSSDIILIGQDTIYGEPGQVPTPRWPNPTGRAQTINRGSTDGFWLALYAAPEELDVTIHRGLFDLPPRGRNERPRGWIWVDLNTLGLLVNSEGQHASDVEAAVRYIISRVRSVQPVTTPVIPRVRTISPDTKRVQP